MSSTSKHALHAPIQLNPQQRDAVNYSKGPLLVLAGAGSGKTRVVVERILRLIQDGVLPTSIIGLTFTNKAAHEMEMRLRKEGIEGVSLQTFHSLGASMLRESISAIGRDTSFSIYDTSECEKIAKDVMKQLKDEFQGKRITYKKLLKFITQQKQRLLLSQDVSGKTEEEMLLAKAYHLYEMELRRSNAVDFDDLLLLPNLILRSSEGWKKTYQEKWEALLIDEYQDTNFAQFTLARSLAEKHLNICAVGDPDQSIYSWRGANIKNILEFERDYPGALVVKLEQNYRSTETILQASNALIANNDRLHEKNLWSQRGKGERISVYTADNDRDEADFVVQSILGHKEKQQDEIAVLYRTNAQSRALEDALLEHRVPYAIIGGISFYARKEIKDLVALLRFIHSDHDFLSYARLLEISQVPIGGTSLAKIKEGWKEEGCGLLSISRMALTSPQCLSMRVTKKMTAQLEPWIEIMEHLRSLDLPPAKLLKEGIDKLQYLDYLRMYDPESYEDRYENVMSFMGKAMDYEEKGGNARESLSLFLNNLALLSSHDEADGEKKVILMTLHHGKGLEFSTVFITGLEEGLFPHVHMYGGDNPHEEENRLEEERRLCYVGMTRAKDKLYLSWCRSRFLWGERKRMRKSRFLKEVPPYCCEALSDDDLDDAW